MKTQQQVYQNNNEFIKTQHNICKTQQKIFEIHIYFIYNNLIGSGCSRDVAYARVAECWKLRSLVVLTVFVEKK